MGMQKELARTEQLPMNIGLVFRFQQAQVSVCALVNEAGFIRIAVDEDEERMPQHCHLVDRVLDAHRFDWVMLGAHQLRGRLVRFKFLIELRRFFNECVLTQALFKPCAVPADLALNFDQRAVDLLVHISGGFLRAEDAAFKRNGDFGDTPLALCRQADMHLNVGVKIPRKLVNFALNTRP